MTEEDISKLYARLALQFDTLISTLVMKNLIDTDFVPGIRKDFYDSLNEEKVRTHGLIMTYTEIIRWYIRKNAGEEQV